PGEVGLLAVRRQDGYALRGRGVEQLVLERMAPLVDEGDGLLLGRGLVGQEHVEMRPCRRGQQGNQGQGHYRPRCVYHAVLASVIPGTGTSAAPGSSYDFQNRHTRPGRRKSSVVPAGVRPPCGASAARIS